MKKESVLNLIIQIAIPIIIVTFGYARFTAQAETNTDSINQINHRVDNYEEKLDKAIKLLERIDERTKRL